MAIAANDVFSPNAVAELAFDQINEKLAIITSGYVKNITDRIGHGTGAYSIDFPYDDGAKDASGSPATKVKTNARTGTPIDAGSLVLKKDTVAVKGGIYSKIWDEKQIRAYGVSGSAEAAMANNYLREMAKVVEQELITVGGATTLEVDLSAEDSKVNLSLEAIDFAIAQKWESSHGGIAPLVVCHPMAGVNLKNSKSVMNARINSAQENLFGSQITNVGPYNVMTSRLVPYDAQEDEYTTLIIAPDAIELYLDTLGENGNDTVHVAGTSAYQTTWWFDFAAHLSRDLNPRGVIKLITNCQTTFAPVEDGGDND